LETPRSAFGNTPLQGVSKSSSAFGNTPPWTCGNTRIWPRSAEECILVKLGYKILEKSKYKKNRDPRHIYTYIHICIYIHGFLEHRDTRKIGIKNLYINICMDKQMDSLHAEF